MSMTTREFLDLRRQAALERIDAGRDPGPMFGNVRPLLWYDQFFGVGLTLAGAVDCPAALRVGAVQNALDAVVVAHHNNTKPLSIAEGTTVAFTLLEGDSPDGPFVETAPSYCISALADGLRADPGSLLFRFPIGNMTRPWCKVRLVIDGTVSGGVADVALAYRPR